MKINKILLTIPIVGIAFISAAFAENVSKIKYVGCKRIEPETISSYLPIQEGDEVDDNSINEALKSLNNTGFFEEVHMDRQGSTLVVTVKEYPMINKISFEGNSKLADKDIEKAIQIKSRETLSPAKVKEIQQGLLEAYRKMGRYNASVNPKVIKLDNNRVNLVFEINEGDSAGIERIVFIGNNTVASSELRDVIYSKVKRWYRFFVTDDIYDQERLQEDKASIVKYYHDNGYANARIISGVAELSSNKKGFVLTFAIDEGEQFKFGDVKVKSNISKLSDKDLSGDFYCKKGEKFSSTLLEVDNAAIAKNAGKKGFSAVKVEPKIEKDDKNKTVNVVFNVTEGEKIYISKIVIKGNTRTKDHVIRREIAIEEGDAYNQALINMAEGNLRGLGFFKVVNVETIPDPNAPDKCIVQVSVEEAPTGEAMVAASYSTQDSVGLDLTYNERNFFGTGKTLSVFLGSSKTRSGRSYEIDENGRERKVSRKDKFRFLNSVTVTATDPHFMDKDLEGSISAYRYQSSKWDGFTTKEIGTSLGLSYNLSQKWTQSWDYTASSRKFDDVSDIASPIIKYQVMKKDASKPGGVSDSRAGKCGLSSIKHTISYGTQFLTGLKGSYSTGLSTTFAGLGGDARHMKNELFNSYNMPISRKTSLKLGLSCGLLTKVGGKNPNIVDSYSMGLDSFRGFDNCGFGPFSETTREIQVQNTRGQTIRRSMKFRDYIGAKKYWKGTAELSFPIGLPEELQFRGFVFSDIGTLWDAPEKGTKFLKNEKTIDKSALKVIDGVTCDFDKDPNNRVIGHKILDSKKVRASIGLGISFVTPFGPMKFTYAMPIRKEKYDEPFRFLIGFTTTF